MGAGVPRRGTSERCERVGGAARGVGVPASDAVGESEGRSPSDQLRRAPKPLAEAVGDAVGADGLIASMARVAAGRTLFLDVRDFALGGHFAVASRNATARECRKSEQANEAHTLQGGIASGVPDRVGRFRIRSGVGRCRFLIRTRMFLAQRVVSAAAERDRLDSLHQSIGSVGETTWSRAFPGSAMRAKTVACNGENQCDRYHDCKERALRSWVGPGEAKP